MGAAQAGIKTKRGKGDAVYVLAADEVGRARAARGRFHRCASRVLDADGAQADVVLPALDWTEQQGHIINMEGLSLEVQPFLNPAGRCRRRTSRPWARSQPGCGPRRKECR
jgi:NADH dehydrogenase/NADH:ubiquinone oxidoreductase subunit G